VTLLRVAGVELSEGQTLEVCGASGTGKTQTAIRSAVEVAATGATCLYIDCELSLVAERAREVAAALISKKREERRRDDGDDHHASPQTDFDADASSIREILGRIRVFRVLSVVELRAVLHSLPHLATSTGAKLVVIDGLAMLFRGLPPEDDTKSPSIGLMAVANRLVSTANRCKLCVLCTNHVTFAVTVSSDDWLQCLNIGAAWRQQQRAFSCVSGVG
jgi:RecA/RadA recombinase